MTEKVHISQLVFNAHKLIVIIEQSVKYFIDIYQLIQNNRFICQINNCFQSFEHICDLYKRRLSHIYGL
jgi:hypothetical protein